MKFQLRLWHLLFMIVVLVTFDGAILHVYGELNGGRMFDYMVFGYDQADYRTNMRLLGETGLATYKYLALPMDMIHPFIFGLTLLMAWEMLIKSQNPKLYWIGAAVLFAGILADYTENVRLGFLLFEIEKPSAAFINITSNVTILKWVLIATFLVLLVGSAIYVWQKRRRINA